MKPTTLILKGISFFFIALAMAWSSCNTPSEVVIGPAESKIYSGQINGEVTVQQSDLETVSTTREQFVTYLKNNLKVIELAFKKEPGPSLPKQYYFLEHSGATVDLSPRVTISNKSTANNVVFNYSFGEVSRAAPLQDPAKPTVLSMLKPYRVQTPASIVHLNRNLDFTEKALATHNNFQVVYLTECDPVYNEYHFLTKLTGLN